MSESQALSVGRPLKFESPEVLRAKAQEYFDDTPQAEWLITGLALHLQTSRKVLMDYEQREDEYSNTIKWAKTMIESAYESDLRTKGGAGSIFGLKNLGWIDRQEVAPVTPEGEALSVSNADAMAYAAYLKGQTVVEGTVVETTTDPTLPTDTLPS